MQIIVKLKVDTKSTLDLTSISPRLYHLAFALLGACEFLILTCVQTDYG